MATTRMWPVKSRIDKMVDYVTNEVKTSGFETVFDYVEEKEKTLNKQFVSYINCSFDHPEQSMMNTKIQYNDKSNIMVFHGIQSFNEGEVTAEKCHEIGVKYAKRMWGDCFEVVVATHLNTKHYHNHFVVNATSFVDGKRYCNTNADLKRMRQVNDEICKENNLQVLESGMRRSYTFKERHIREMVREGLDYAIEHSVTLKQFNNELDSLGFETRTVDGELEIKHPCVNSYVKISNLGNKYQRENIIEQLIARISISDNAYNSLLEHYKKSKHQPITGIRKLYIRYLYLFGIIPKNYQTRKKYSKETYQSLKNLERLSEQMTLMAKYNIVTIDDLSNLKADYEMKIDATIQGRLKLRNKIRYCKDPIEKKNLQEQAKSLTKIIQSYKKETKSCDDIALRSQIMRQYIQLVDVDLKKKKLNRDDYKSI